MPWQCQVALIAEGRPHRAVAPFGECHFAIPIGVGDSEKVSATTERFMNSQRTDRTSAVHFDSSSGLKKCEPINTVAWALRGNKECIGLQWGTFNGAPTYRPFPAAALTIAGKDVAVKMGEILYIQETKLIWWLTMVHSRNWVYTLCRHNKVHPRYTYTGSSSTQHSRVQGYQKLW
jgi:hypothetical protein